MLMMYYFMTPYTQQDCEQLQKDLDLLGNWVDKWKMVFNHHKCEFLRITNKKHPTLYKLYIKKKEIKEVIHAKYLGVTLSHNLSWSKHIKQITSKTNRTKGFLQRNLHKYPSTTKSNCYKAMVKPILEYAAVIWSVTKNLVRGKKRSGRTIFSRQNLVRGTKFGYQNRSGLTENCPV